MLNNIARIQRALTQAHLDAILLTDENDRRFATMSADQVEGHMREAVQAAGRTGLMLGPGCVAELNTPADNFYAAKAAIGKL